MKHDILVIAYLATMGAVIILADVLFLRDHFWWRLGVNVAVVAVFALVYIVFLRNVFK